MHAYTLSLSRNYSLTHPRHISLALSIHRPRTEKRKARARQQKHRSRARAKGKRNEPPIMGSDQPTAAQRRQRERGGGQCARALSMTTFDREERERKESQLSRGRAHARQAPTPSPRGTCASPTIGPLLPTLSLFARGPAGPPPPPTTAGCTLLANDLLLRAREGAQIGVRVHAYTSNFKGASFACRNIYTRAVVGEYLSFSCKKRCVGRDGNTSSGC